MGSMYKEKRMGPRIESWGTPQDRGAEDDAESPSLTEKHLSDRYDRNHSKAAPLIPTQCSTVSKAAVRSKSI